MISVIIPAYNNPDALLKCTRSLVSNVSDPENMEILVRVDKNDPKVEEYLKRFGPRHENDFETLFYSDSGSGYNKLHIFVNELAKKSKGDWILMMTDDAIMKTENWDKIINKHDGNKVAVLNPCGNGLNLFPIVSRKLYNILGHLALQCHYDTYLQDLSGLLNCYTRLHNIDIEHTGPENSHSETSKHYYSKEIQDLLVKDCEKVKEYLTNETK